MPLDAEAGIAAEIKAAEAVKAAIRAEIAEDGETDEQLLQDMIEGETDVFEMLDRLAELVAEDQELVDGISNREADLRERKSRIKFRQGRRRAYIEQAMTVMEAKKLERPEATLSLSKRADRLVIVEEADIPSQFWKPGDPVLDKAGLKEAMKALGPEDTPIPGVVMEPSPQSLTIRRR